MNKTDFENRVEQWATNFIQADADLALIDMFKKQNISRLAHPILDNMETSKLCDFICDFVFLVKCRRLGYQLILINRYTKSVGLKDIGEMLIYAKIAKPLYAYLISASGHSTEINNILVDSKLSHSLFNYDIGKDIVLFALREEVMRDSVIPTYARVDFYRKLQ